MPFLARLLSYVFHPIFAPLTSMYILFQLPIYINYKMSSATMGFIYTVILVNLIITPLGVSLYLKRKGFINSLEMPLAKERTIPYLVSSLFYIFTYYLLEKIEFPPFYLAIFKAAALVIIALMLLSLLNIKASAHLAALGGICGMIFVVAFLLKIEITLLLVFFILLSGVVASARYALKAHSFTELIMGFLLGFGMQLFIFL